MDLTLSPTFEIKDFHFDNSQIANCHLSIEVAKERLSFCIYSHIQNAIIYLEDYVVFSLLEQNPVEQALKKIYSEHTFFASNNWKSIIIIYNTANFTLIPDELFIADEATKYLQLAAGKSIIDNEQVYDYHHNRLGFNSIFGIDKNIIAWFKEMYPIQKNVPIHIIDVWIEGIMRAEHSDGLHLLVEGYSISIVEIKDSKLQYCNKFYYKTTPDLVYHVLFVINELGLSFAETQLILYGEITLFAESYELLSQHVSKIKFAKNPKNLNFSKSFEDLPEHRYFTLFASNLLI